MRTSILLSFCALLCLLCSACGRLDASTSTTSILRKLPESQPLLKDIIKVKSNLSKEPPSPWKVETIRVSGQESLKALYFLDEIHGWVGGGDGLYETLDGGRTWGRVKIDLPEKAKVANIFFISPSMGWVVAQKKPSDDDHVEWDDISDYQEIHSWLLSTKDGGQSWQVQHEGRASVITKVSFMNEQEGWLIGNEITGLAPYRFKNLLFHTLDGGQHWVDAAEALNRLTENEDGTVREWVQDFQSEDQHSATVLFLGGRIFKTNDIGLSWQQLVNIPDNMKLVSFFKLGVREDKHLWVAGGNYGRRGILGTLAIERDSKSWMTFSLSEAYFKDALVLPNQQALACGLIPVYKEGSIYLDPPEQKYGTIFYSSDEGHSWEIIYHNAQIKSVNALAAIDSDHIWAVGESGLILRLEPPSRDVVLSKN